MSGADVIVDVTNSPSFDDDAVMDFFRTSTGNLLSAAKAAGVSHYVALSVVGCDRIRDSGYLRAKRAQEGMIEAGGVPYTMLRATQFCEFLGAIADGATQGNEIHMSPSKFQPVAADDVAATLARIATAQPRNGVVELAGPDASGMAEFIQKFLTSKGGTRKVVADPEAKYFGAVLDKDGLAPANIGLVASRCLATVLKEGMVGVRAGWRCGLCHNPSDFARAPRLVVQLRLPVR
ncbi:MAG TPA: NAD(P)H-binding protein, partial [Methyloceanibacter sp.]|nr:NAD(P)H-binding protein [Methyloceanibacter sp.]